MENSGLTLSVNHKGGAPAKDGRMEIFARRPRMAEKDPAISFTRAPNPSGVLLCRIPGGVKTSLESQGGPGGAWSGAPLVVNSQYSSGLAGVTEEERDLEAVRRRHAGKWRIGSPPNWTVMRLDCGWRENPVMNGCLANRIDNRSRE